MTRLTFSYRRRGISLVIVLVVIALATTALLIGAAALISVSRQRLAIENGNVAELAAKSALMEGQSRIALGLLNPSGEYGVSEAGSVTAVSPRERGYQSGTSCGQLVADGSTAINDQLPAGDSNCPKQSVLIRRFVEPQIEGNARSHWYQVQDFHNGALEVIIRSSQGLQLFFIGSPNLTALTYELCPEESGGLCQRPRSGTNFSVLDAGTAVKRVRLTGAVMTGLPSSSILEVEHPNSTISFALSKGYRTIEATGTAPDGTTRRYLTIERPSGTVTRALGDTFSPSGLCVPNNDACR